MKYFSVLKTAVFLLLLMTGTTAFATPATAGQNAQNTPLIIDVRTPQEFQSGHIKGAINIEYQQIVEKIPAVTQDKKQRIALYCRSGNRSGQAQKMLQNAGYENVVNLGGFEMLLKDYEAVYPQKK